MELTGHSIYMYLRLTGNGQTYGYVNGAEFDMNGIDKDFVEAVDMNMYYAAAGVLNDSDCMWNKYRQTIADGNVPDFDEFVKDAGLKIITTNNLIRELRGYTVDEVMMEYLRKTAFPKACKTIQEFGSKAHY